ncbi:MAG TPA: AI-2E family transporter [Candidatus Dormibacteraeota bacterium]|jgi:predicted PurR-regulated permease PerM|nr:AI-2E family transporter [Candidatus Dormibacteraeota bacterium]
MGEARQTPQVTTRRRTAGQGRAEVSTEPLEFETTTAATVPADEAAAEEAEQERGDLQRSTWKWIRAAAVALTLFLGWQLLLIVQGWIGGLLTVVLYAVFGTIVAFVATPLMRALERWLRFPHLPAVLTSLFAVLAVVVGLVLLLAGPLAAEVTALAKQAPTLIRNGQQKLNDLQQLLNAHGISVGTGGADSGLGGLLGGGAGGIAAHIGQIVITGVAGVITLLIDTIIVLVTAFWLLHDGTSLRRGFVGMLPGRVRDHADFALDATRVVIGGYVRAQLFLALVIGMLAWIGCTILGVPYPIVVGVAAGVFELVPLLGPFLGGAVGVLLALTRDPVLALWTIALFVVIHVIEGYILAPRIQAKFIQLHPLVAFLALIAGIEVSGLLGALFAIPATSLGAVFLRTTIGDWRANRPDLFQANHHDAYLERRRRSILREFRVLEHSPAQLLTQHGPVAWLRRARGHEVPQPRLDDDEDIDPGSAGPIT